VGARTVEGSAAQNEENSDQMYVRNAYISTTQNQGWATIRARVEAVKVGASAFLLCVVRGNNLRIPS
jgi:hypothetical protein